MFVNCTDLKLIHSQLLSNNTSGTGRGPDERSHNLSFRWTARDPLSRTDENIVHVRGELVHSSRNVVVAVEAYRTIGDCF